MSHIQETEQFENLCQKFSVWIISYSSPQRHKPVFLIWYTDTDENNTDRLLTDKSGDIVAVESLADLLDTLLKELSNLTLFEQLVPWLDSVNGFVPVIEASYDTGVLVTSIAKGNLNMPTIEGLVNWINLFGDFTYQDTRNGYLEPYHRDKHIRKAWDYYYDNDFWPRFNGKVNIAVLNRPPLFINTRLLLKKLMATIDAFEARIHLIETPA